MDQQKLSPAMQSTITLLLIVHLFALGVGVLANARPVSPLRNQLGDVPGIRPYLQLLNLDLAYNFHLTDGTELDIDHSLVIDGVSRAAESATGSAESAESSPEVTTIRLPELGLEPLARRKRYHQLALTMMPDEFSDPSVRTTLLTTVGDALLRQTDQTPGNYPVRIERQTTVVRENAASPNPEESDPYASQRFETAVEGTLLLGESSTNYLAKESKEERALVQPQAEVLVQPQAEEQAGQQ